MPHFLTFMWCRQVQHDIYAVTQFIQSPDELKAAVAKLYQTHVTEDLKRPGTGSQDGGRDDMATRLVLLCLPAELELLKGSAPGSSVTSKARLYSSRPLGLIC